MPTITREKGLIFFYAWSEMDKSEKPKRMYVGNPPHDGVYLGVVDVFDPWLMYFIKYRHGWAHVKICYDGEIDIKANYWLNYNLLMCRFAQNHDFKAVEENHFDWLEQIERIIRDYLCSLEGDDARLQDPRPQDDYYDCCVRWYRAEEKQPRNGFDGLLLCMVDDAIVPMVYRDNVFTEWGTKSQYKPTCWAYAVEPLFTCRT